jgi:TonB family protein
LSVCVAAGADLSASNDNITGEYVMGAGASRVTLTLFRGGTFKMDSPSDMGGERRLRGEWHLYQTQLVLRTTDGARKFRWILATFPRADGFDLVPEETVALYNENPKNIGSRYRRVGSAPKLTASVSATPAPADNSSSGTTLAAAGRVSQPVSRPASWPPKSAEVATSSDLARHPPLANAPGAVRIAKARDLTIFTYMPAPNETPDMRRLSGPGLARIAVNERGQVSNVTVLQSTGFRAFDADAVDTLRQWRTKQGVAREIELPLTTVMSGKRRPIQTPTSGGTMTSG